MTRKVMNGVWAVIWRVVRGAARGGDRHSLLLEEIGQGGMRESDFVTARSRQAVTDLQSWRLVQGRDGVLRRTFRGWLAHRVGAFRGKP